MSATPISRLSDSADLTTQVAATARRFAQTAVLPRLRALDSGQSGVAWAGISADLVANGLLDPAFESTDACGPPMVAAILREIAQTCSGTAAAFWAHYSASLPYWLAGRSLHGSGLLASPAQAVPGTTRPRFFGSTASTHGVISIQEGTRRRFECVSLRREGTPDGLLGLRACRFDSAAAESESTANPERLLLDPPLSQAIPRQAEAISLAWLGSIAVSNARSALNDAREYAKSRYQGCSLLMDHPVLRQMLGRMEMLLAAASALVERAVDSRDPVYAGLAKACATSSGEQICLDAVQVLGGYGYMEDYGLEKRLRDAKTLCILGEPNRILLDRAADTALGGNHGD